MIIIITGATHTGKTLLAQRLLEKYKIPYLSVDHLKMGLIRSNFTSLTPLSDDEELTALLWPVVSEMIKTAIENNQNLIVEGCYFPVVWDKAFSKEYLSDIKFISLVMSEKYIQNNFDRIASFENVIEKRLCAEIDKAQLIKDNNFYRSFSENELCKMILIDDSYEIPFDEI